MDIIFKGSCDLCKNKRKLLKILPKDTSNILNTTFGLKISPTIWRICTQCNYEITHVIMEFLKMISTNSHPCISPDVNKCYCCNKKEIIKSYPLKDLVAQIREIGLAVPQSSKTGEIYGCFSCIYITETVVKYKQLLQSSQIYGTSVRPYQNLTETIITAKKTRTRKNMKPIKIIPKTQKCFVMVKKLNINVTEEGILTPKNSMKNLLKPVKLHKGQSWAKSDLAKCHTEVDDVKKGSNHQDKSDKGYCTDEGGADTYKRNSRKRKIVKHDDFLYDFNGVIGVVTKSVPKKTTRKPQKVQKTKPCRVVLHRLEELPVANGFDDIIDYAPTEDPLEQKNDCTFSPNNSPITCHQNENSPPNIPPMVAIAAPFVVEPKQEINEVSLNYSSACLTQYHTPLTSPIKSILTQKFLGDSNNCGNHNKSVSFSECDEVFLYEQEISSVTPEVSNEIELTDVDDELSNKDFLRDYEDPQKHEIQKEKELDLVIEEIISQNFENEYL